MPLTDSIFRIVSFVIIIGSRETTGIALLKNRPNICEHFFGTINAT